MSLYKDSDVDILDTKIDDITKKADILRMEKVEPTKKEIDDMVNTVLNFVIEKKRKIYGGFALNKLIGAKNSKDKFYDDDEIPDIDFYSPDPIGDVKELCDRLKARGHKYIRGQEAQHKETYKIFANTIDCADISYVPKNIYNRMPFQIVDKLYLIGPHYMMIDYFRMMSDPLTSYFRIEKSFKRLNLLTKHYPLPKLNNVIEIADPNEIKGLDVAFMAVHDFLINKQSVTVVGLYAYNHLVRESKITEKKNKNNINYVNINYYEMVSTNYKIDALELINNLKTKFQHDSPDTITYVENYPFFQYVGYGVDIMYKGDIIVRMYHHNSRCLPYKDVPGLYFKNGKYEDGNKKGIIRIGSFSMIMLFVMIDLMRARTNNDDDDKDLFYSVASNIISVKNYFLESTKKTIFDDSLFQEFILNCIGSTVTPQMEKQLRIEKKKASNKKYMFSYDPSDERNKESDYRFIFANSSGNQIRNEKNLKLNKDPTKDIDSDDDEEEKIEDKVGDKVEDN